MINKHFKTIRQFFFNKKLPKFIFFNNLKKTQFSYVKKIAIWLMCNKKELLICKKCNSCTNFKKKSNYDYYEIIENKEQDLKNKILILENFIKTKPIHSDTKVIFLSISLKDNNITNLIKKIHEYTKIYFFFVSCDDFTDLKKNCLTFDLKKNNSSISINIVKKIYNCIAHNEYSFFLKYLDLSKIIIVNSLIFFLFIYSPFNYLKRNKILMNYNIKTKLSSEKVLFLLRFLFKYKIVLLKNDNLNIFYMLNFVINCINN